LAVGQAGGAAAGGLFFLKKQNTQTEGKGLPAWELGTIEKAVIL